MYTIGTKKNREDVIALRWPKACLSCGEDVHDTTHPKYAIIGKFHEVKQTQVLVKLPGFFYMCPDCENEIRTVIDLIHHMPEHLRKLALNLKDNPWNEFLEVEKSGSIKVPLGLFRDKLQKINPDALIKTKPSPMSAIGKELLKSKGER